jgi:hypothetical protein
MVTCFDDGLANRYCAGERSERSYELKDLLCVE